MLGCLYCDFIFNSVLLDSYIIHSCALLFTLPSPLSHSENPPSHPWMNAVVSPITLPLTVVKGIFLNDKADHITPHPFITHLIGLIGSEPLICYEALQWPDPCSSLQLHLLPPFPCLLCLSQTHLLQVQECVLWLPDSGLSHAVPSPWNALILCPSAPHLLTPLMLIYPVSSSKSPSSGNPFLVFHKSLDTFPPLPCPFMAWISICNYLVI